MATLPKARTTVSQTAGALAAGTDTLCVIAPVSQNADAVPRLFGSAAAVYQQHAYCDGVELVDFHVTRTGKNVLFIGVEIATPGVIGRVNKAGNTGSAVASVVAGGAGVLGEHDGVVEVERGGTIGTSQIALRLSLDGGRTFKRVKLGTGSSYAIPYVNVALSFAAGTLVAGDRVIEWHGSGPRSDATGWAAARTALAAQLKFFRSIVLVGDLQDHVEAQAFLDQVAAYRTENERFVYARASIKDRLPEAAMSHDAARMTGTPTLTFANVASADTCMRSAGSWIADGVQVGDTLVFGGTASNNVTTGPVVSVTDTVLTFGATTTLTNEGPVSNATAVAYPTLTFAEVGGTADTIVRNRGSFVADGFRAGDFITIDGTASNDIGPTDALASVTPLTLTLGSSDLAAEVIGTHLVTITAGQTKAAWAADNEDEFETVRGGDDGFRLDMSWGRQRFTSNFSQWFFRFPVAWVASCREYQHDLHIATHRKSDGPTGGDLFDADGNLVEWDDRVDGEAGAAAGFTVSRTWGNGPAGAFIAQSLTRGDDGTLLSRTNNVAVVNLAMTIVQSGTENAAIGVDLLLNDDGTATTDSLARIQKQVNDALEIELLSNKKNEGQRASKAVWTPDPSVVFNVAEPEMLGTLDLNLKGTVHSVGTVVRIRSGGQ